MPAHRRFRQPVSLKLGAVAALALSIAACQAPQFPERADMLPADAVGAFAEPLVPLTMMLTPERLQGRFRDDVLRFAEEADGADAVAAVIEAPPYRQVFARDTQRLLLEVGIPSTIIYTQTDNVVVRGERVDVVASRCPDWREVRIAHPIDPLFGNPFPADQMRFGCVNDANLEVMVARPGDLGAGATTGPAVAATAVGAVERYRNNEIPPLPDTANFDVGGGS